MFFRHNYVVQADPGLWVQQSSCISLPIKWDYAYSYHTQSNLGLYPLQFIKHQYKNLCSVLMTLTNVIIK